MNDTDEGGPVTYERLPRERWSEIVKEEDAWWTVIFVDRVATPLAVLVTPWRIFTPTRITMAAHVLGIVSLLLFWNGSLLAAALVFQVRFILDCVDGKLARARNQTSLSGAFLDFAGDLTINTLVFGVAAAHEFERDGLPLLAVAFVPSVYLLNWLMQHYRSRRVEAGGPVSPGVFQKRMGSGVRGWLSEHRLRPLPRSVDFEHTALFVGPIAAVVTGVDDLFAAGLVFAAAYFTYQTVHVFLAEYRALQAA